MPSSANRLDGAPAENTHVRLADRWQRRRGTCTPSGRMEY